MSYAGDRGERAPVFMINEADRDVQIGGVLPVHVLPLLVPSAITSVEELAAGYIALIQRSQPFGPYRLLGNALGGLVAYELASQLLGRDERVEFLGMIDCPRPRNLPPGKSGRGGTVAVAERYCPQPLPIPVYYFVSDARSNVEVTRSWRALAGDSLRVITSGDTLTDDVLADAIAKAPKQQFLQSAADQEGHSPLVTLQVGLAHNPPVIFVPGAGGTVTSGMALVESLRERTTVHAMQPRGIDGAAVPHRTVQAAAAVYLRAIRQIRPAGPYRLAGHSFGGWAVFEIACRLAAEGEAVDPVVLLDSDAPAYATAASRHRSRVDILMRLIRAVEELTERSMNLSRNDLLALDYESQLSRLTHGMKALGVLSRTSDVNDIRGLLRVHEVNANTSYVAAARFPGSAVLFQPTQQSRPLEGEEERDPVATREAWRQHVGRLECIPVPGNHMTMLKKPHVELIARHLSTLWSEPPETDAAPEDIALARLS